MPPTQIHLEIPLHLSNLDNESSLDVLDSPDDAEFWRHGALPEEIVGRTVRTTSMPHHFATGTGSRIYDSLGPLLETTNQELILVTCFWAKSESLTTLNSILMNLSNKGIRQSSKIRVRLCFSSLSLWQKLFHEQSGCGQEYDSRVWKSKLGLPGPDELMGLDLTVKSIFILPFSVMHPKFMIIDRKMAVLPSCNISWEDWFEGYVTFTGAAVTALLRFYCHFWERRHMPVDLLISAQDQESTLLESAYGGESGPANAETQLRQRAGDSSVPIPTFVLPSAHHRNPQFQPFASFDRVKAPRTSLNSFVLNIFDKAETSIRIQTPNLTAPPVLSALLKALSRGVNVTILTSERLMILEQLVTAGTTTSRCMKKLIKRYKALYSPKKKPLDDEEAAIPARQLGRLQVCFFSPVGGAKKKGQEQGEPQQSHLKMTVVDDVVVVLGSGNLDRASWFTSQELGMAFFDKDLVEHVLATVDRAMEGRRRVVYTSTG
ncbi:phospholipase D/nuclease [Sporormia fimetaria CBS 119925]|uniref:Phospholipase D/nuclease n=1 Tax=Sporormia fimetaria CBS 119925 TaxID=1340428 RepID=A0A6A6V7T5_9PLEO|nr:phospholipase D/nuclease [Sporormia fimetaria CBS 119925]